MIECELLGDEASGRKPKQVNRLDSKCLHKISHVASHCGNTAVRRSGRPAHSSVVEKDHVVMLCDRIHDCGVPVIQISTKMLQEQKWRITVCAEPAISVSHAARLDKTIWGTLMGELFTRLQFSSVGTGHDRACSMMVDCLRHISLSLSEFTIDGDMGSEKTARYTRRPLHSD